MKKKDNTLFINLYVYNNFIDLNINNYLINIDSNNFLMQLIVFNDYIYIVNEMLKQFIAIKKND